MIKSSSLFPLPAASGGSPLTPFSPTYRHQSPLSPVFQNSEKAHRFVEDALLKKTEMDYVSMIRLMESKDTGTICQCIQVVNQCTSILSLKQHEPLIREILKLKWATPNVMDVVCQFILHATTTCPELLPLCMKRLVQEFLPPADGSSVEPVIRDKLCNKAHETLQQQLQLFPTGISCLLSVITSMFPHKRFNADVQRVYLVNVLHVMKYVPSLLDQIIAVVVDRLIQIDVEIRLEDFIDENEEMCFNLELAMSAEKSEQIELASKLDLMMDACFDFTKAQADAGNILSFYNILCESFDKLILSTYKSKYTQFLMFYALSFGENLVENFLGRMLHCTMDVHRSDEARKSAVCYLGSLLARGKFVTPKSHRTAIQLLMQWLHSYIELQDQHTDLDISLHSVFYTACQNLFYVLCYEFNNMSESYKVFIAALDLDTLLCCHLSPLTEIFRGIAVEFARGAVLHQLLGEEAQVKCHYVQTMKEGNAACDPFFPFDPYLLKLSCRYVDPLYRTWNNDADDASTSNKEDEDIFQSLNRVGSDSSSSSYSNQKRFGLRDKGTPPFLIGSTESDRNRFSPMNLSYESAGVLSASFTDKMSFEDATTITFGGRRY